MHAEQFLEFQVYLFEILFENLKESTLLQIEIGLLWC